MIFKWLLAPIVTILLAGALPLAAHTGSDIAGTVPRILTAISDKDARCLECTLGDAEADAVRTSLQTDIAIVCGGDLVSNLLPGEITYDDLKAAFREDRTLAVVSVTPKELRVILEAGLSHIVIDKTETINVAASVYDGFPQVSGITLQYDATGLAGDRINEIKVGGNRINLEDDTTVYRLAATEFMLGGGYGLPSVENAEVSTLTLSGAFALFMGQKMPDYTVTGSRIYPMGTQNGSLKALIPTGIIVVVLLLIVVGNGQRLKNMYDFKR